ncbi:Uncharacterised protein [Achromobacter xylosoxidans]|nr:Uncharacterised protein [Achromobacter xylosoxidans]
MPLAARRAAERLPGAQFQVARRQQEGDEHGDRIEIHFAAARIGGMHAGDEGGDDAQRHRHVHAGAALAQVGAGVAPDRPGRIQHHRHGQGQAGPVHQHDGPVQRFQGVPGDAVMAQVARPGEHHDLHHRQPRQRQAHQRVPALLAVGVGQGRRNGENGFCSHAPMLPSATGARLDLDQAASDGLPARGRPPAQGRCARNTATTARIKVSSSSAAMVRAGVR